MLPAVFVFLLVGFATSLPCFRAQFDRPDGGEFSGAIFAVDDFQQYASFAEQAARGVFFFSNKFDAAPHVPALINLEWWVAGLLSKLVGQSIPAAFFLLRLTALGAMILAASRLLGRAGLDGKDLTWALLLVATGGGLGWLRMAAGVPLWRSPDLLTGLYPWHQAVGNAHFVVGLALLLWTIEFLLRAREGRVGRGPWVLLAWCLALARPYDLVPLLCIVAGLAVFDIAEGQPVDRSARQVWGIVWLAPVFAYYAWLTQVDGAFSGWGNQASDMTPRRADYVLALGVPLALAAYGAIRLGQPSDRELRRTLALWCGGLITLLLAWNTPLTKQALTSLGAVTLIACAVAIPRRWLPVAALALFPTSALVLFFAWQLAPAAHLSAETAAIVGTLRKACQPGDVAIAPTDTSLAIAAGTPCHVAHGHRLLTPRFAEELAAANAFYDPAADPAARRRYLDSRSARFVVLPRGGGPWLGPSPPFEPLQVLASVELWGRGAAR